MTFNILQGGGDPARFSRILQVIEQAAPDLLILQECLDWQSGPRLDQVAEVLGGAEVQRALVEARPRASGRCYHLAVFSRLGWQSLESFRDPAFLGHALLRLQLDWQGRSLTVFGAHFDAHSENLRFVEARFLRSLIDKTQFASEDFVLAGDLNALSTQDPYPPDLEALLRQSLTSKFHLPPRFEVMEELAQFGWRDGLYLRGRPPAWVTAPRQRGGVKLDFRSDYLMFSPALAPRVAQVEILPLHDESDHFPVLASLN